MSGMRRQGSFAARTARSESLEERLFLSADGIDPDVTGNFYESEVFRQALVSLLDPEQSAPDLSQMTDSLERVMYSFLDPGGIELSENDELMFTIFAPGVTYVDTLSNFAIEMLYRIDPAFLRPGVYEDRWASEPRPGEQSMASFYETNEGTGADPTLQSAAEYVAFSQVDGAGSVAASDAIEVVGATSEEWTFEDHGPAQSLLSGLSPDLEGAPSGPRDPFAPHFQGDAAIVDGLATDAWADHELAVDVSHSSGGQAAHAHSQVDALFADIDDAADL